MKTGRSWPVHPQASIGSPPATPNPLPTPPGGKGAHPVPWLEFLSSHRLRFALALLGLAAGACAAGEPSGRVGGPTGGAAAVTLSPAADPALIEWRRPAPPPDRPAAMASPAPSPGRPPAAAPPELVSIGLGGLWIGLEPRHPRRASEPGKARDPRRPAGPDPAESTEDTPRAHYRFARRQRADDLARFAHEFAPFRLAANGTPGVGGTGRGGPGGDGGLGGELVFRGRGATAASAAERRMIFEWTRAVTVEAGGGGIPMPYGLALAWHRGAAGSVVCDDLAVYLSGEVRAASCGAVADLGGRLQGERLERLYGWIDGLAPFQETGEQGVRADALLERLIFAGRGRRQASRQEVAAITAFAGALHRELAASAGAAPAPAGATPPPPRYFASSPR
jgi:hypothetical protein